MFKSLRTGHRLDVSQLDGYLFEDREADESLFFFESFLDVSENAKNEASEIDLTTYESVNPKLMQAVKGRNIRHVLEAVDNNTRCLEFCEAVLVQAYITQVEFTY